MSRYTHLTTDERKSIAELFYQGCSTREIARRLDRDPSTISRELRRNRAQVAANCTLYHPGAADMAYKERRKRCVRKHVLSDQELHHAVHFALGHLYWSPEQICERLRLEGRFFIGTSTIYRALESGYLRDSLKPYLRRKYKTMGKPPKNGENALKRAFQSGLRRQTSGRSRAIWREIPSWATATDPASRRMWTGRLDLPLEGNVTPSGSRM